VRSGALRSSSLSAHALDARQSRSREGLCTMMQACRRHSPRDGGGVGARRHVQAVKWVRCGGLEGLRLEVGAGEAWVICGMCGVCLRHVRRVRHVFVACACSRGWYLIKADSGVTWTRRVGVENRRTSGFF